MKTLRIAPVLLVLACQGDRVNHAGAAGAAPATVPPGSLAGLAQKRIYFGHQSVGYNIVDGIAAVAKEHGEPGLQLVEARSPDALARPAFAHSTNGRNHEPLSKIQAFAEAIEGGLGATTDVAMFKFCYVDFTPETDHEQLFAEYRSTMARLRESYPDVRFVHVTVPLTVVQTGPKAFVKKLLGKPIWGAQANVVREKFNELMRKEYAGKAPLFDLAAVEATLADGRTVTFEDAGARHRALAPEYASDGKHLNAEGARWAAVHLLRTLAQGQ